MDKKNKQSRILKYGFDMFILNFYINKLDKKRKKKHNKNILQKIKGIDTSNNHLKVCRICYDHNETKKNPLIYPCKCCGTSKYIHSSCLDKWRIMNGINSRHYYRCELCNYKFKYYSSNHTIFKDYIRPQIVFLFIYLYIFIIYFSTCKFNNDSFDDENTVFKNLAYTCCNIILIKLILIIFLFAIKQTYFNIYKEFVFKYSYFIIIIGLGFFIDYTISSILLIIYDSLLSYKFLNYIIIDNQEDEKYIYINYKE